MLFIAETNHTKHQRLVQNWTLQPLLFTAGGGAGGGELGGEVRQRDQEEVQAPYQDHQHVPRSAKCIRGRDDEPGYFEPYSKTPHTQKSGCFCLRY